MPLLRKGRSGWRPCWPQAAQRSASRLLDCAGCGGFGWRATRSDRSPRLAQTCFDWHRRGRAASSQGGTRRAITRISQGRSHLCTRALASRQSGGHISVTEREAPRSATPGGDAAGSRSAVAPLSRDTRGCGGVGAVRPPRRASNRPPTMDLRARSKRRRGALSDAVDRGGGRGGDGKGLGERQRCGAFARSLKGRAALTRPRMASLPKEIPTTRLRGLSSRLQRCPTSR